MLCSRVHHLERFLVGVFAISELIVRFTMYVRSVSWQINEHIHL